MIPHDLRMEPLPLPPGERRPAVYLSGNSLRHLRLGYLIQQRFPGLLARWWMPSPRSRARSWSSKIVPAVLRGPPPASRSAAVPGELEARMFGREVEKLREAAALHPTAVDSPNSEERVAELRALSPYFIIAFGGSLLRGGVLACARGIAINQHAGWAPELKGASTTETALYHRQIGWVGNTVHVMNTFADAGPILRRSGATLHPDDTPEHCFLAVTAVGSKLILEVIAAALASDELAIFPQPAGGRTVLSIDYDAPRQAAVRRDFAAGWLGDALRSGMDF